MHTHLLAFAAVLAVSGLSAAATVADLVPAESMAHPQGVSLREGSQRSGGGGFFLFYLAGRGHRGGGLHAGK